ncbi:hypothetical protein [Microbispora sp. CA-102843]|uniref:hypothetical protein n=1 Tax=Microbispora sp. CA-102843 TaxID=3239952 RepID=UPI003D90F62F
MSRLPPKFLPYGVEDHRREKNSDEGLRGRRRAGLPQVVYQAALERLPSFTAYICTCRR